MANLKQSQKLIMQVVLGENASPQSTITNGLEVTTDSSVDSSAGSENELTDVAGASLSPRGTITGTLAGNATINGYLKSTDGVNEPAIANILRISGMAVNGGVEIDVTGDVSTLAVRDIVTGDTSGAIGTISAIDGQTLLIETTSGTFTSGETIATGIITDGAPKDNPIYVAKPDSDSDVVGSIYAHYGTNVTGITNARGNFTFSADSGGIPKFAVTGLGQTDVVNRTMVSPEITYEASQPVVFKDSAMKITWADGSYVPVNSSIEYDLGSAPSLVNDSVNATGIDSVTNSSRAGAGGSMTVYMENYDDFDAQALKNLDTVFDVEYRIGNGEDSRTIYVNQRVQFGQISISPSDGLVMLTIPLKAKGTNDDEAILVFK